MSNSAANIAEKATAKVVSPVKEAKDTAKNAPEKHLSSAKEQSPKNHGPEKHLSSAKEQSPKKRFQFRDSECEEEICDDHKRNKVDDKSHADVKTPACDDSKLQQVSPITHAEVEATDLQVADPSDECDDYSLMHLGSFLGTAVVKKNGEKNVNLLLDLIGAHVVAKISPHLPELMKDPSVLDLLQRVKSARTGTRSEYATRQLGEHVSKLGRNPQFKTILQLPQRNWLQFDIGNSAIYEILKNKVDLICTYQMDNLFRQTLNEHHYVTDLLIHILELELQYYVSSAAFEENAAKITNQNVYNLLEDEGIIETAKKQLSMQIVYCYLTRPLFSDVLPGVQRKFNLDFG